MPFARVMKFGGAALCDGPAIQRACQIIQTRGGARPLVVVSAHQGVTDMLDTIEGMFLCLGNRQKWIDRLCEIREEIKPDALCIRTRNPVNEGKYYPSRQECLEVIERFGEILPQVR